MPKPKVKSGDDVWELSRAQLKVQGKGNKLIVTIPVNAIRALKIREDMEIWAYHNKSKGRVMYELHRE